MKRFAWTTVLLLVFGPLPAYAVGWDLDGTLVDKAGAPLADTTLLLLDGQGRQTGSAASDKTGHYHFSALQTGSYVLEATKNDQILTSMTVSILNQNLHKDLFVTDDQALHIVVAHHLTDARNNLSVETGTNAYKITSAAIDELPEGDDTSLDKVLEQAPGVAQDSFGQVHVRGEHADLQYRLNGILLPEGISGFGQTIDPQIISSATLLDGTLPAQYGYRTAGVVDIQTKTGLDNSGKVEFQGGSYGTIQPSIQYGGTYNDTDYFLSASHLSSDFGIEPPTGSSSPVHDHTEQNKQFGYASWLIDPSQRVEMIAGNSLSYFQIPNNPGQTPAYCVGSLCNFNSSDLNERQFESNQYATVAWQGQKDDVDIQVAPYIRSSETHFRPDMVGDLIFNGVASDVQYNDLALGLQADGSWKFARDHTLRAGLSLQQEHISVENSSLVFATSPTLSTTPDTITDSTIKDGQLYGVYLQDEWQLTSRLTMNYGLRFDVSNAYVDESQLSPRLGFLYRLDDRTSFHAGYARYFTPPPLELVAPASLSRFANTTNAPTVSEDAPVKAERTHSFDIGATHQLTDEIKLGVDAYYKISHDLLDEGQFSQALVFTPFNYEHGRVYGVEGTVSYQIQDLKAYGNLAVSRALGEDVVSSQFNFSDPAELAYIQNNWVHLDHDQTYTASAGIDYKVLEKTSLAIDGLFGTGLRSGFANTGHLPHYATFDGSITQDLDLFPKDRTSLRLSVINILDATYELRSGDGIGVGAPQYGMRRAFLGSLSQNF